jgi:hypothetical protein
MRRILVAVLLVCLTLPAGARTFEPRDPSFFLEKIKRVLKLFVPVGDSDALLPPKP